MKAEIVEGLGMLVSTLLISKADGIENLGGGNVKEDGAVGDSGIMLSGAGGGVGRRRGVGSGWRGRE